MDWNELCREVAKKLSDTLASGGPEGPDALAEAEYGALLLKAIDTVESESDLADLCAEVFDKIYWARREHAYYWLDLTETSTFHAFRQAMHNDSSREEMDSLIRRAGYELDHILRISHHVTPDIPAMNRYATILRATISSLGQGIPGTQYRATLLDRIYRARKTRGSDWLDVLWKVSMLCATRIDEAAWKSGVATACVGALPTQPVMVAPPPGRVESPFEGMDVTVTLAAEVTLTKEQRETLRICAEQVGSDMTIVLLGDRTCMALNPSEARYGFDYLIESAREEIAFYRSQVPEHSITHLGGGTYLMSIFGTLLQVIKPGEYPEPPDGLRQGVGIPLPSAHKHRDRALTTCAIPSALAAAVPNRTLPDRDNPTSRSAEVCAQHGTTPGIWCAWYYYDDEGWPDTYGPIRYEYLKGIWHTGEGAYGERYAANAFIVRNDGGRATGPAADAHCLLGILRGDACLVTEINSKAMEGLSRRERVRIERHIGIQPEPCESEAIQALRDLEKLSLLASDSPLLMIGTEEELQDGDRAHYFRFLRGTRAVRWAMRSADINLKATLDNVERICEPPEGSYLNPEAAEMRTLLRGLLEADGVLEEGGEEDNCHARRERPQEAENHEQEDHAEGVLDEALRRQETDESEVRRATWRRQITTVAKETVRILGAGPGDSDHGQVAVRIKEEVAWFSRIQPASLSEALLYLTYLADIDRCGYTTDDDDTAVARRLIWEYVNRDKPDHPLWKLGLCNRTPSGGYLRPGDGLRRGCSVLVVDGPLRTRRAIVSDVGTTHCEVALEAFGRRACARMHRDDLLMIDPVPSAVSDRATSFEVPPLPESAMGHASRTLVILFEFARHQPDQDDMWAVSKYLYFARNLTSSFRSHLWDVGNSQADGAVASWELGFPMLHWKILDDYPLDDPAMRWGHSVEKMVRDEIPVKDCFDSQGNDLVKSLLVEIEWLLHAGSTTNLG